MMATFCFWRRVFGCWLLGLVSCLVQDAIAASIRRTTQRQLVAFTSDVTVRYEYSSYESPSPPYLELYDVTQDSVRMRIILWELSGDTSFGCDVIDHAGVYTIRMRAAPTNVSISELDNLVVTWPSFFFRIPDGAETLSKLEVEARANLDICNEFASHSLQLVLNFISRDDPSPYREQPVRTNLGRTTVEVKNGNIVGEFPCDVVNKEGFYSVSLVSTYGNINISTSGVFHVTLSSSLSFILSPNITASCTVLNVTYEYAGGCGFVPESIGVYGSTDPAVSFGGLPNSPLTKVSSYVAADRLGKIGIDCEDFESDVYTGYCFKFEGLSGRSGDRVEAVMRCLPTRQPVTGIWGPWLGWDPCTASCGDSIRRQERVCHGAEAGYECQGNKYRVEVCEVPRCPQYEVPDLSRIIPRDVDPGDAAVTPPSCNYVLSSVSGVINSSPQSCPRGATWVIRVANNKRIRLEFLTFNLYLPQEYIRIRDGVTNRAKILAFNTGQLLPGTITSSGNQIYVEYEVFAKGKPPERGFSASYTSVDLPQVQPSPPGPLADGEEGAGGMSHHTTIILAVGISLLVLLLLLTLVMTVIIRFKEERNNFDGGAIQKIYTGPRGSFNSSTTRSNQRLFGVPGHSTTSPSEHSHQSVSKRGFPDGNGNGDRSQMYLIPENSNMQYLPETALSSPFKSPSEMQSVTELPSPYKEETGPKWPVPKKDLSLPFHFGNKSIDDFSRQSEIMTDKNTIHLANKTPSEYATRGYSAHGSTRGSRSSVDSKRTDASRQKRVHAKVENSDNTSPFVSPNGELTPQGITASRKVLNRPTRLNRSPEGAESPDNYLKEGTLTKQRSSHDHDSHGSDKRHHKSSHRSGARSSKSGLSSDAGLYSPDSTAERSGGSKSGSSHPSRSHHHHHHQGGRRRRKSPSKEENISMKDINSSRSSHHKRKHSPSSPRTKSRNSESKSPRSPRSQSSSGSGRKYRPSTNSRANQHGSKLYSPATSENSRYNSLPYSRGTDSSLGNLSPVSEPSPIRLPKPLTIKQNRDQYKQVFISDESLMNKVGSGPDRSGAESSRSGVSNRQLPTTPSSGSGSPTKNLNVRRVYSDKSLSPEEPAFDNYMPSIPGSYFENPYPQHIMNNRTSKDGNLSVV